MSACRLHNDLILRDILVQELSTEDYNRVCARLDNSPKVDAIPVVYIEDYAKKHDPVCQLNLKNLITNFHLDKHGGWNERLREE